MPTALSTFTQTAAALEVSSGYVFGLTPGTNRHVTDIKGWYSPAGIRAPKTERQGAHGSFEERGWKDERVISLSANYGMESRAEAAAMTDLISAYLADGTYGRFTVDDVDLGVRSARVRLEGTPEVTWRGGKDVQFSVDMSAPDPRKYGPPATVDTGPPQDGGGLFMSPLFGGTVPGIMQFGDPGSTGVAEVVNSGSADALAVMRVTGYAPGFTVTELGTGRRLVYTGTVPTGSTLTLDPHNGTAMLDGADRGQLLTRREWTAAPAYGSARYLFETAGPDARLYVDGVSAWW